MHDHAGLRQREGEERADGIEGDDAVDVAAEQDEDDAGQCGERVDAVGEEQAAPAQGEDMGQVVVDGNGAGDAREVRRRRCWR